MIRVLLVDDQPLLLSGFAMILSTEDDIEVVGQARDGREGVAAVAELEPDVVLMDVQMPVLDGIEATRAIAWRTKVVILTTFDRDDYLFDALAAGASGFLLKNADPDDLVDAVRTVASGHALLAPEVTSRVISRMAEGRAGGSIRHDASLERLTAREREVLELVARGLSNAEIAAEMFVGDATVKTHVSNVLAKLHLRDRVQAVVFAYEAGLVRPAP
ncbi:response regulator [Ornithinimicrobium cryptoxanthini]|uniref:Response regulator transcription factor n=1 Tax=Ornithinimicrobium cryptoxanthini TaxID=2934161 RepID=A0ABY4YI54_9MICO|nr:response regulator transcription factor [Ornithinimicrobium cryptoxanthini]USQ76483.1 response regulator transcription factor [Ornithinimicrobium cryptoxanthini]